MAKVIFAAEMRLLTGVEDTQIQATSYRAALRELKQKFPQLSDQSFDKFAVAIDNIMIQSPMLETFQEQSELVFVPKIPAG
ncbi:hypothetical protein N9284_02565 [Halieaceae bacterium]|jgi:molybdopterin converting factor small subunit|nr:hypothetical protein [Halieaceae bacterium]